MSDAGWLSVAPPVVAIALAIRTRQPAVDPARRGAGVVVASGG